MLIGGPDIQRVIVMSRRLGRKGIFVSYSESAKAYRIYISGQKKIELSRDVTFEEDVAYRRSRHTESDNDKQEALQC